MDHPFVDKVKDCSSNPETGTGNIVRKRDTQECYSHMEAFGQLSCLTRSISTGSRCFDVCLGKKRFPNYPSSL